MNSVWFDSPAGSGDFERSYLLAAFTVLASSEHGDTATATAAITTVATLTVDETAPKEITRTIGTLGIREDTARWTLVRDRAGTRRWRVVGDGEFLSRSMSNPTVQLFRIDADEWRPDGASLRSALATVDSVRRARGRT